MNVYSIELKNEVHWSDQAKKKFCTHSEYNENFLFMFIGLSLNYLRD